MDHEFTIFDLSTDRSWTDFAVKCNECGYEYKMVGGVRYFNGMTYPAVTKYDTSGCTEEDRIIYRLKGKR